jgi:signal transduction histidine kinase
MNNRYILLFIFFVTALPIQLRASDDKIDSLRQVIANNHSDKEGAKAFIIMAKEFIPLQEDDSIRFYAERALEIALRIDDLETVTKSYLLLCWDQWKRGQLPEALSTSKLLKYYAMQINNDDLKGKAHYHQGVVYGMMGEADSAISYFKEGLSYIISDSSATIPYYLGLGHNFDNLGAFDSALHYKLRAARLAELQNNKELDKIYSAIGITLDELGETSEAEKYFKQSLEIAYQNNDQGGQAAVLVNLGRSFYQKDELDSAIKYLDWAKELYQKANYHGAWSELNDYYGLIYTKQKKYDLALNTLNRAMELNGEVNELNGLIENLTSKSDIYAELKQYDRSLECLDSAWQIATEQGFLDDQRQILEDRSSVLYLSGNYQKAYEDLDSASVISFSLFNQEKANAILDLKFKYEKEKDQARIFALEKETLKKTLQRNLFLFNSSALLVAALFLWVILRHRLVKTRMISQQKIQKLEDEKKIMMARNIVEGQEEERKRIAQDLHDGLGVILSATKMQFSSLGSEFATEHPTVVKAIRLLEQATGEVRRISHNMMPGLLTKLGLWEAIEDMFDEINEIDEIRANIEIEGERLRLPENVEIMLYRIIQEMVNNTMKYAKATGIDLSIIISDQYIIMNYKDDGIGFDVDEKLGSGGKSLGLKSIESRVVFLNGELKMESAPGKGVNYLIKVPVILN